MVVAQVPASIPSISTIPPGIVSYLPGLSCSIWSREIDTTPDATCTSDMIELGALTLTSVGSTRGAPSVSTPSGSSTRTGNSRVSTSSTSMKTRSGVTDEIVTPCMSRSGDRLSSVRRSISKSPGRAGISRPNRSSSRFCSCRISSSIPDVEPSSWISTTRTRDRPGTWRTTSSTPPGVSTLVIAIWASTDCERTMRDSASNQIIIDSRVTMMRVRIRANTVR